MCTQKTTFADLINRYGIAAVLLSVLHTFVLVNYFWICEEGIFEVPYFVLYSFQFGSTVSYGLVPVCDSVIFRRSSQSFQGFGASLPVTWSHPTLAGIMSW